MKIEVFRLFFFFIINVEILEFFWKIDFDLFQKIFKKSLKPRIRSVFDKSSDGSSPKYTQQFQQHYIYLIIPEKSLEIFKNEVIIITQASYSSNNECTHTHFALLLLYILRHIISAKVHFIIYYISYALHTDFCKISEAT